jgi:hypothetical protein
MSKNEYYIPDSSIYNRKKSKLSFLLLLFLFTTSFTNVNKVDSNYATNRVYICTSKSSYAYHKYKDCEFILKCKAKIISVSLVEAQKSRKPCGSCYMEE